MKRGKKWERQVEKNQKETRSLNRMLKKKGIPKREIEL
jgi:hypothetical protein